MRSPVKVALLGYGTVGRSVARILDECTDEAKLTRILMRPGFNPKDRRMTDSFESILDDHSIEVVSTYFSEFVSVGEKYGSTLRIEACVGGGIPWIAGIEKAKRIDAITGFSGILNGTTNYIVYSMLKDGTDFAEVLGKAQELGYAERDPSADIDGLDVRAKTMISATVAFDVRCTDLVPTSGIRNLTRRDLAFFGNHGRTVKLFGRGVCEDGRYAVAVEPVAIPMEALEAHVPLNFNIATLTGKTIGELTFYGQGAGGDPTANAVVQDILDIAHKNFPTYSFVHKDSQALIYEPELLRSSYVIRTEAPVCDGRVYEPGAYIVRDITALQARELLDEALKSDPTSFMAALGERK